MSRWQWIWRRVTRRLWLRATLIGMLGVFVAAFAAVGERFIPWHLPGKVGADSVESLLNIIASSMLAVTTFSLSVATSAFGSATSNVTPRSTKLLMEDRVTQNVLSTFVGSFLFAIVGIIVLKTGAYGERGRIILFVATIGIVVLIVITLLRWIDHLTRLGRVADTTHRVEEAARQALEQRLAAPFLGGHPLDADEVMPPFAIHSGRVGYLQHVDMGALSDWADEGEATIFVAHTPGAFLFPGTVLAWTDVQPKDDAMPALQATFTIGDERNFDQDPRFGLVVMAEIAARALSPAVNDPGTAIDVIGRVTRLLALWAEDRDPPKIEHPRVRVPSLADADLFEDAFMPIARDGAALVEVQLRLQKALAALSYIGGPGFRAAARHQSALAWKRSEQAMTLEDDLARIRQDAGRMIG